MRINIKLPYILMLPILVFMASHAQSTQSNKFAKSLQYLKIEVCDKIVFSADKHQSFLPVDAIIFNGCDQAS